MAASWYSRLEWDERMATYATVVANSEFTRRWISARWGVDSTIVYPPCTLEATAIAKEALIVSVGRFSTRGHTKSQLDLAQAFATMGVKDWSLTLAGSVGDNSEELAYLKAVQAACTNGASVLTNRSRDEISQLYGRASIYWHAAGFGNTEGIPDHYEHFGMTTVEAMSAGCVPLVFDAGGQPEIVEHGVSGFVWRTLDELGSLTRRLTSNPALLNQMSAAARIRSRRFSHEAYVTGMTSLVETPMTLRHASVVEAQA
jgi:glycosyltransferase involved in cell wall biosynthesis